jgi:hypothetical protein
MRALPEAELVRRSDLITTSQGFTRGPEDYLNELTRRETEKQSRRLERLTWALVALTIVLAIATVALVWIEVHADESGGVPTAGTPPQTEPVTGP